MLVQWIIAQQTTKMPQTKSARNVLFPFHTKEKFTMSALLTHHQGDWKNLGVQLRSNYLVDLLTRTIGDIAMTIVLENKLVDFDFHP